MVMTFIFGFSAQPSSSLPSFDWADILVKKGSHVLGYGLLTLSYWRGLGWKPERASAAWLLAIAYAVTDEAHQAFVSGRHPSGMDVLAWDGGGAALAMWARYAVLPSGVLGGVRSARGVSR